MKKLFYILNKQVVFIIIIQALLSAWPGYAQVNPELLNRLSKPVVDCKTIAFNSQRIISGCSLTQPDSIAKILNAWEELCGVTEPTMRLRILLDINNSTFDNARYNDYFEYYIPKFERRIYNSDDPDYKNSNSVYITYLDFVPVNGEFDKFTKEFAFYLIDAQQTNSMQHLMCVLFSGDLSTFNTSYHSKKQNDSISGLTATRPGVYRNYQPFTPDIFSFTAGVCFPSGKLSNSFKPSPFFGMALGGSLKKGFYLALDFKIIPISDNSNITLHTNHDTTTAINSIASIGMQLTKKNQISTHFFTDLTLGAGVNTLSTDLVKKPASGRVKTDTYYSLVTADMHGGVALRYKFGYGMSLALFSEWHYVPYNWDKKSTATHGSQYLLTGILYRF